MTGVQTCALPILVVVHGLEEFKGPGWPTPKATVGLKKLVAVGDEEDSGL